MSSKRHPSKEIQAAIDFAVGKGWRIIETGKSSHAYCRLHCMEDSREGCKMSVWRTPRNKEAHARQIRKVVEACFHKGEI